MRMSPLLASMGLATLLVAGCSNREPAASSVTQAETILEDMRESAATYAPEELKTADATLAQMKNNLEGGDYKAVLADVPKFNAEVKTLQEASVSRQTQAAAASNEWNTLNAEVPKTVEALQVRMDALTGTRLPKEISKDTFEAAKAEFATMKANWAEATAAASAGDTSTAAEKGRTVAAQGEELKNKLGMNPTMAASAAPSVAPPAGADVDLPTDGR